MRESNEFRITMRIKKFKEQNGVCLYCDKPIIGKPSLEHIIPIELGGEIGDEANLCVTCVPCNKNKLSLIVFTNLYDRLVYPIVDIPYFFRVKYIQTNNFKGRKL